MKKIIIIILAISMFIYLSGCSVGEFNQKTTSQQSSVADTPSETTTEPYPSEPVTVRDTFYKDEIASKELWQNDVYSFDSDKGNFKVYFLEAWTPIEVGERLVLEMNKDWISAVLSFEIDPSINSAKECEEKIRGITASFPSVGVDEKEIESRSIFPNAISQCFHGNISSPKGINGGRVNLDDTWWMESFQNCPGACYHHEKSTHTSDLDVVYSLLKYEAYRFMPENQLGALHISFNILSYDFDDYYNSLNDSEEKDRVYSEYSDIAFCGFVWGYNDSGEKADFEYLLFPGTKVIYDPANETIEHTDTPTEALTTVAPTEPPTTATPAEPPTTPAPTEPPTTAAPTEPPTTPAPTEPPTTAVSVAEENPFNNPGGWTLSARTDYAHFTEGYIYLGNKENAYLTIETYYPNIEPEDFYILCDESLLKYEVDEIGPNTNGGTIIRYKMWHIAAGYSQVMILSGYEYFEEGDDCYAYFLDVQGLDSNDGKVVYYTPTGEKYHYSAACAGEYALPTTLFDVTGLLDPCGKCVK